MTKKLSTLIIALVVAASLCAANHSALAYYVPAEGDLIKVAGNPAVYYIDASDTRHLFPNQGIFFSWYTGGWNNQNITVISSADFDTLPYGSNVTARPGYALVRFSNSMVMYAVLPDGELCHAPAHYGNYQYNRALVIPASFESDYAENSNCDITSNQPLPEATLFRYYNSFDIYYVQNGYKRLVTSEGFKDNNFNYDSIITNVPTTMTYPTGSSITGREDIISKISNNLGYNQNQQNQYNSSYNNYNNYSYYGCTENWSCNTWSNCAYGSQYRTCTDLNHCGTTNSKPVTSQSCNACNENWTCTDWGSCQGSGTLGTQYRSCVDRNYCGTYKSEPITSQNCSLCSENWSCTSWTTCINHAQTRSCLDTNQCGTVKSKPTLSQYCN